MCTTEGARGLDVEDDDDDVKSVDHITCSREECVKLSVLKNEWVWHFVNFFKDNFWGEEKWLENYQITAWQ